MMHVICVKLRAWSAEIAVGFVMSRQGIQEESLGRLFGSWAEREDAYPSS